MGEFLFGSIKGLWERYLYYRPSLPIFAVLASSSGLKPCCVLEWRRVIGGTHDTETSVTEGMFGVVDKLSMNMTSRLNRDFSVPGVTGTWQMFDRFLSCGGKLYNFEWSTIAFHHFFIRENSIDQVLIYLSLVNNKTHDHFLTLRDKRLDVHCEYVNMVIAISQNLSRRDEGQHKPMSRSLKPMWRRGP